MEYLPNDELNCAPDDLLVFIDDTGHESFAGNQAYYRLGGCVVLGTHYGWLKTQWMDVRRQIKGSPDAPLHGSDMSIRKPDHYATLSKFFLERSFCTNCCSYDEKHVLPEAIHPAAPVMGCFKRTLPSWRVIYLALLLRSSLKAQNGPIRS